MAGWAPVAADARAPKVGALQRRESEPHEPSSYRCKSSSLPARRFHLPQATVDLASCTFRADVPINRLFSETPSIIKVVLTGAIVRDVIVA